MTDVNGGKKVNVVITKHAEKRCKERNGWKRSASRRMAMKALVNGTPSESTEGELYFWIRERKDDDDSKLYYVFGNHLYIYTKVRKKVRKKGLMDKEKISIWGTDLFSCAIICERR